MSLRDVGLLLLLIACGFVGWRWKHEYDERLRADGRLAIMEQRADSTAEAAAEAVKAAAERDSAAARVIREQIELRHEAESRAQRAAQQIHAAADNVVAGAAPTDSADVRQRLTALQAIYEERDAARLSRIASDSLVIDELTAANEQKATAMLALESALAASRADAADLRTARPGWLSRASGKVTAFIVGAAAGAVAIALFGNG